MNPWFRQVSCIIAIIRHQGHYCGAEKSEVAFGGNAKLGQVCGKFLEISKKGGPVGLPIIGQIDFPRKTPQRELHIKHGIYVASQVRC